MFRLRTDHTLQYDSATIMDHPETLLARRHEIRPEDTDVAGIVHPPRVAHFAVELVEEWFIQRMSLNSVLYDVRPVFASLSCTFLAPMRPGDVLDIRLALRRIGRSSLGFELVGYKEVDDGLCWMAETVCVFVDRSTLKSRSIPEPLRPLLDAEVQLAISLPFGNQMLRI